jgi:integral membrane protein
MPIHKNIFSDKEAWGIYRLSAFGEAFGWTLLIGSLGAQKYLMHGNKILVSFAGQIHGLLFFAYIAAVLATYASLGWSFKKGFLIGLMSVPPYGTLVAEMWLSRARKNKEESIKPFIRVFVLLRDQGKYLFVEKRDENIFSLPGTAVVNNDIEGTMRTYCKDSLHINAVKLNLKHILRHQIKKEQYLDIFFEVTETRVNELLLKINKSKQFDDAEFFSLDNKIVKKGFNFLKKNENIFLTKS